MEESQLYELGERVDVQAWLGKSTGIIEDIKWIWDSHIRQHTWGYYISFEGASPYSFGKYIPEGYLRKLE